MLRLQATAGPYAAIPAYALVTPDQAESSLGRNAADEFDDEDYGGLDREQNEENTALIGVALNAENYPYACMAPPAASMMTEAAAFGLHPPMLPPGELTAGSFRLTDAADTTLSAKDAARNVLRRSLAAQKRKFVQEALSAEGGRTLETEVAYLDPTQRVAYDVVTQWALRMVGWRRELAVDPPSSEEMAGWRERLDFLLLGTAGSGKTHTVKCIVQRVRQIFRNYDAVLACAHTGVASANIGGGASTIDSIFKLRGSDPNADLDGRSLDEFIATFQDVELVVIDEISMVSAYQLEMIHRRLQQLRKAVCRSLRREDWATCDASYGGVGMLKIGDFAQLAPVMSTSLLPGAKVQESSGSPNHGRACCGQRRFKEPTHVLRLRRIHRQLGADPYKESTMRLRDAAMTLEDHKLWQQHELTETTAGPTWEDSENLEERALHLVVEKAICGRINGKSLRRRVEPTAASPDAAGPVDPESNVVLPIAESWRQWAVKIKAHHNRPGTAAKKAEEFRQLRSTSHLCLGAPVMLTQNSLWDEHTVSLSLINGARGTVVAILYPEREACRVDGLDVPGGWPCGTENCPLPDFVVVNFPDYQGSAFFGCNLPRTWVPVPAAQVRHETRKTQFRVGMPLKLCWALTVHKSQGLTCKEGIVVDLSQADANGRNPIAAAGVAFVAWTRAVTWSRVAFRSLPTLANFIAIRQGPQFQRRQEFEAWADTKHDELMTKRGVTADDELKRAILSYRIVCRTAVDAGIGPGVRVACPYARGHGVACVRHV